MDTPELIPRISREEIASSPSLHSGVHLDRLVKLLNALGVFGVRSLPNWQIAHRMYEARLREKDADPDKRSSYDPYAENRFEEILYKPQKYPLVQREIDYFRKCLERAFGQVNTQRLSDEKICTGHPTLLVNELLSENSAIDLADMDPLTALLALGLIAPNRVPIEYVEHRNDSGYRNVLQDGFAVDFEEPPI